MKPPWNYIVQNILVWLTTAVLAIILHWVTAYANIPFTWFECAVIGLLTQIATTLELRR